MKRRLSTSSTLLLASVLLAACSSELDDKAKAKVEDAPAATDQGADASPSAEAGVLALDAANSKIEFVGAKVSADHRGSFGEPTGEARLGEDGSLAALEVKVETKNVAIEPPMLEKHLKSDDFFDVEKYPEATFVLAGATAKAGEGTTHEISGDLNLRGVTKRITFPAKVAVEGEKVSASASFKIDRKDFGITYAGMADDLIKDEVLLELDLAFAGGANPSS